MATVILLPDNDETGEAFMSVFESALKRTVRSLKKVKLKEFFDEGIFPKKGDIEEFIALGGKLDWVYKQAENTPELSDYKPYITEDEKGKKSIHRNLLATYMNELYDVISMVDGSLRVYSEDNGCYELVSDLRPYIKKELNKGAVSASILKEVAELWTIDIQVIDYEDVDKESKYINVQNGLFEFADGKLVPHRKDIYSTVQLSVDYNTEADGKHFKAFLDKVLPDVRWQEIIQEVIGYTLSNHNGLKKVFILHGVADSGKSTMTDIMYSMFNYENRISISLSEMDQKFQIGQFFGKQLCVSGDVTGNKVKVTALLKRLLSDYVNSQMKWIVGNLDFKFKGKFVMTTNKVINFDETDSSLTEKLLYIPFNEMIERNEREVNFSQKLIEEKEYVFLWAMEGLKRLVDNNFVFSHTELIENHRDEQVRYLNPVGSFVEDMIEYRPSSQISTKDLYEAFQMYLKDRRIINSIKKDRFSKDLNVELEVEKTMIGLNSCRMRGYKGIVLKSNK